MNTVTSAPKNLRLTDRLSFRLLALFLFVFFLLFLLLWAWSISTSYLETAAAEASPALQPKPVVVDPNLRNELSKVMAYDTAAQPAAVRDPFNDRGGLVAISAVQRSGVTTAATGGSPSTSGSAGGTSTTIAGSTGGISGSSSTPSAPQLSAEEGTKQRYAAWLDRAMTGDLPLDPRVFSIEDLLPVGVVDGGEGRQEVLFYSEAAARTVSFPVGTMFFDGWLTELRPEGVVFSTGDERRVYRLRSWARSLRTVG